MNIERLKTLRDVLAATPDKMVNLDGWRYDEGEIFCATGDPSKPACGTIACVLGWACMVPEFQAAGLKLIIHDGEFIPTYQKYYLRFRAGEEFFELETDTARKLFRASATCVEPKLHKQIALARLDWLIEHGDFDGYNELNLELQS